MKSRVSPEIEQVYEQLLWIERRRFRITASVSAHFGRHVVDRALATRGGTGSRLDGEPPLAALLDDREPGDFLASLAPEVEHCEALAIVLLRSHVSVYREHVDEQILFGARTAGQEAGRAFLSRAPALPRMPALSVPEAVQAVFEMSFNGPPGEKNHFLLLRSRGGSSAHFSRSPHLSAWKRAGAELAFMYSIRCEWMRGALDILSPGVELSTAAALERGEPFGLEHFFLGKQHAGP